MSVVTQVDKIKAVKKMLDHVDIINLFVFHREFVNVLRRKYALKAGLFNQFKS